MEQVLSVGTCIWVIWTSLLLAHVWRKTDWLERKVVGNRQHARREADRVDEGFERPDDAADMR